MENIQPSQPAAEPTSIQTSTRNTRNRVLGVALILLGAAFILSRFVPGVNALLWAAAFAAGAFSAFSYGRKKSSKELLFALAYVLALVSTSIVVGTLLPGPFLAATINFGIAAPFLYAYSRNRKHWGWLLPGGLFAGVGALMLATGLWAAIPMLLVVGGIYLLVKSSEDKQAFDAPAEFRPLDVPTAETGPDADR